MNKEIQQRQLEVLRNEIALSEHDDLRCLAHNDFVRIAKQLWLENEEND